MAKPDMRELGTTGLRRVGGTVTEEFLTVLQGRRGTAVYKEMADNDPVVGAVLFAIERLLTKLDYRVDPATSAPEDVQVAEFVHSCLHDMNDSWDSTVQQILSMLRYGWAWHEVVYKKRMGPDTKDPAKRSMYNDGRIGWRKFAIRSQETWSDWVFDKQGDIVAFVQEDPATGTKATIPIERSLLFRTTTAKGNPEGRSVLRNAYRPWWFKKKIEEIEAIGIERDLAGLPVAYVPPEYLSSTASTEQLTVLSAMESIVRGIKRNEQEGVIMPMMYDENGKPLFDLKLLSSGGARQFDTDKVVSRYDQRIAMSVLADFVLLGHENTGSYALGTGKMDMFTAAIEAWASSICDVVNKHAIPKLLEFNGIGMERRPVLTYGQVKNMDLNAVATYVLKLTQAGALTPDEPLEMWLRDVGGMPALGGQDELRDL